MLLLTIFNSINATAQVQEQSSVLRPPSSMSFHEKFEKMKNCVKTHTKKFEPFFEKVKKIYINLRDKYNDFLEKIHEKITSGPIPKDNTDSKLVKDQKELLEQILKNLNKIKEENKGTEESKEKEKEEKEEESKPKKDL